MYADDLTLQFPPNVEATEFRSMLELNCSHLAALALTKRQRTAHKKLAKDHMKCISGRYIWS